MYLFRRNYYSSQWHKPIPIQCQCFISRKIDYCCIHRVASLFRPVYSRRPRPECSTRKLFTTPCSKSRTDEDFPSYSAPLVHLACALLEELLTLHLKPAISLANFSTQNKASVIVLVSFPKLNLESSCERTSLDLYKMPQAFV